MVEYYSLFNTFIVKNVSAYFIIARSNEHVANILFNSIKFTTQNMWIPFKTYMY